MEIRWLEGVKFWREGYEWCLPVVMSTRDLKMWAWSMKEALGCAACGFRKPRSERALLQEWLWVSTDAERGKQRLRKHMQWWQGGRKWSQKGRRESREGRAPSDQGIGRHLCCSMILHASNLRLALVGIRDRHLGASHRPHRNSPLGSWQSRVVTSWQSTGRLSLLQGGLPQAAPVVQDTSLSWGQRRGGSSLCVRWWYWQLLPWIRD